MATSILIVDDESRLTKALSSILKASGYVVSAVENGRQALSALQASEFDLVLLDILMPEMDGLEFLKELADAKIDHKGGCHVRPTLLVKGRQGTRRESSPS